MDAELVPVTVKLPRATTVRIKVAAKRQGKKLQAFYAELLKFALERKVEK